MFIIFRNVITSQEGINIGASLGTVMFAFMWVGSAFSIFAFVIHLCLSCCGASRRDVKNGRRKGSKKAYGDAMMDERKTPVNKKKGWMPKFGRRKSDSEVV